MAAAKTTAKKKATRKSAAKAKPTAKPNATAEQAPAKEARVSGLDAAAHVLRTVRKPMRVKDVVDHMLGTGMWKTNGKTPAATIYVAILREIKTKGDAARFRKVDRGLFEFKR